MDFVSVLASRVSVRRADAPRRRRHGGRAGAASFQTDKYSKIRLARTVLALLAVAFLLAGGAQSLESGRIAGAAELRSVADKSVSGTDFHGRSDEYANDQRSEDDPSEFEIVMTTACNAGDVLGCGLLFASRALVASLRLLENLVILVVIAQFPWFIWTSLRETIEKRRRKANENAHDSSIGPRLPTRGSDSLIGPGLESERRRARRQDRRLP